MKVLVLLVMLVIATIVAAAVMSCVPCFHHALEIFIITNKYNTK